MVGVKALLVISLPQAPEMACVCAHPPALPGSSGRGRCSFQVVAWVSGCCCCNA